MKKRGRLGATVNCKWFIILKSKGFIYLFILLKKRSLSLSIEATSPNMFLSALSYRRARQPCSGNVAVGQRRKSRGSPSPIIRPVGVLELRAPEEWPHPGPRPTPRRQSPQRSPGERVSPRTELSENAAPINTATGFCIAYFYVIKTSVSI